MSELPPTFGFSVSSTSTGDDVSGDDNTEGIAQQNERYKMVIQTLSRENEALKRTKDASEWMIKQNKELSDEVNKLKTQLYHWQNSANDANDRLARLSLKKGKKNTGEIFYDGTVKRIIETLANENQFILENVSDGNTQPHRAELLKKIDVQEKTIQNLRQANEYKFKENRRLQNSIKLSEEVNGTGKLLDQIKKCQERITFISHENTKLKSYLIQKHNVMEYLKMIFEKTKDDMIKIFVKCYKEDRDNFLDQLKDSENEIPEFMTRPLVQEIGIQTSPLQENQESQTESIEAASCKFDQERFDSGIDSLTPRESIMFQDSKLIQERNQELSKELRDLKLVKEKNQELSKENQNFKQSHEEIVIDLQKTKTEIKENKKLITELENDVASWKTALTQAHEEGTHLRHEAESAKDQLKTAEVQLSNLKQQVPFHVDTRRLLQERNELQESLRTMEAINHNLHSIIDGKQRQKQPPFKKSFSADTQTGQSRSSRYPTETYSQQQQPEYLRNIRTQQPTEPWQQPFHQADIGRMRTTVDLVRDSVTDSSESQQTEKRMGTSRSPRNSPTQGQGRKGSPTGQPSKLASPEHQNAAQLMEGIGRSIREELFPCENCGKHYPSSIIWEHIRTCTSQQYDD